MLSSLICTEGRAVDRDGVIVGGGDCWGRAGVAGPIAFSPILSGTFRVHSSSAYVALVAHSSTCDVASTYGTGVLCSMAWVRMYIARHL